MKEAASVLEEEVRQLRRAMEGLEARVKQLEGHLAAAAPVVAEASPVAAPVVVEEEPEDDGMPSLRSIATRAGANLGAGWIGAMLLALAGGFLLRAVTESGAESGAMSRTLGTAVGLGYALLWALVSPWLAARGHRRPATAAGLVAALIVLPLAWEGCVRFGTFSPAVAAAIVLAAAVVLLLPAERFGLHLVTATTVLGAGAASLAMSWGSGVAAPFLVVLAILAIVAAFRGPRRGGASPWFAYACADIGVLLLLLRALGGSLPAQPALAVGTLAALAIGSLAGFIRWSRASGRTGAQATLQGGFATLAGLGGALALAGSSLPVFGKVLAVLSMAIGGGGYLFLLVTFRWSRAHRWPFLLYSSLGLAAVALGAMFLFPEPAWFFAPLALLLALAGSRLKRVSPTLHAALCVLLAAAVGGVVGAIYQSLIAPAASRGGGFDPVALACLVVAAACAALPLKTDSPIWPDWMSRAARSAVVLVTLLGVDALLVSLLAGRMAGTDAGSLAALRTGVLALSVVLLAAGSRLSSLRPARALVWPLLVGLGLKLLAEDIPQGRPMTMAIALLLGGGALILSSHLLRAARGTA